MEKIDFLIVGQGLAGSILAFELIKRGHTIAVIDPVIENTSSNKAAGLYNPITGRNLVKTWLADELFANLGKYYRQLESELDTTFHKSLPIYRPFHSTEELNDWMGKEKDEIYREYVSGVESSSIGLSGLQDYAGGLLIKNSGYVNLPGMLEAFRSYFLSLGVFHRENLSPAELEFGHEVIYKNIEAKKIIFCEGPRALDNHWWSALPFNLIRGEVINIKCNLPADKIYNRGVFMLPKDGCFRVGSTYDHDNLTYKPQQSGITELERRLKKLYTDTYEISSVSAGVRPTTNDRRPYIGWHPENKAVGIFNGFGTKGVSLVPYFSKLFVDSIEGKAKVHVEADVSRVF